MALILLTQRIFSVWPVAQPVVGEMEMHLATFADPFSDFFPPKKAAKPYLVTPLTRRARSRLLSDSQSGITSQKCGLGGRPRGFRVPFGTGPLSPHLLSFCSASTHTHLSLSLSLSLSASAQFLFSTCAHISLSLSASAQFLFSARQRRAEQSLIQLNTDIVVCFSNFTCKYSQNHSTAIVIILWVFYLIRQWLDYNDFCAD